jgi:hypothetical protein
MSVEAYVNREEVGKAMYVNPRLYFPRIFTYFSVLTFPTKSAILFLEKGVFSGMNQRTTLLKELANAGLSRMLVKNECGFSLLFKRESVFHAVKSIAIS